MPAGRDQLKPMQRLVRIMAMLDQAGRVGVLRDDLIAIADYGDSDPGSQLALDLKRLRQQGWQIDNVVGQGDQARYVMVPGDNRLRLRLAPAQLASLQRAVLLAERADLAAALGVPAASVRSSAGEHPPREQAPDLSLALQAVQLGCRLTFSYKGTTRVVHPAAVRFQNHHWYLSGVEDGGDVVKNFVVGRMSATHLDRPGSARPVPEVQRLALHPLSWAVDEPVTVVVRCERDYVPDVERWLRAAESVTDVGDDEAELTYVVTNRAAFRSRVYVLGTRLRVVGPSSFRDELVADLRRLGGA